MKETDEWEWEIDPGRPWFRWELGSIVRYRDLLFRLVRRDLLANYKQTVLGAFWILLQPIMTTLVYWLIFSNIVKVPIGDVPPLLFYLSGIICWNFFSDCLNGSMYTFLTNAAIFNKVYFPRLIVPFSSMLAHSIRLSVQLVLLFLVYFLFYIGGKVSAPGVSWLLLPPILLLTGLFGLGAGLIISVLTAKYRDLDYTLQFVLRIWMFASPVFYPAGLVKGSWKWVFWLNPLAPLIELFRSACFGIGEISFPYLIICIVTILSTLILGIALFKRHELKLTDII
ncbi:MAG: ABC transporter permease [Bacteroidetes bacterium]|nr:ABC transporter permease [Bacteroidota bacterium]